MVTKFIFSALRLSSIVCWALVFKLLDSKYNSSIAGEILFLYSLSTIAAVFGRGGINVLAFKKLSTIASKRMFKQFNYEIPIAVNSILIGSFAVTLLCIFSHTFIPLVLPFVLLLALQTYYMDLLRALKMFNAAFLFGFFCSSSISLFLLFVIPSLYSPIPSSLLVIIVSCLISCCLLRFILSRELLLHKRFMPPFWSQRFEYLFRTMRASYPLALSRSTSLLANETSTLFFGFLGFSSLTYLVGMSFRLSFLIGFILHSAKAYVEPRLACNDIQFAFSYLKSVQKRLFALSIIPFTIVVLFSNYLAHFFIPDFPHHVSASFIVGAAAAQLINTSFGPLPSFCELNGLHSSVIISNILSFFVVALVVLVFSSYYPFSTAFAVLFLPYLIKNLLTYMFIRKALA